MLRPKHRLEMADARDCDQEARENRITNQVPAVALESLGLRFWHRRCHAAAEGRAASDAAAEGRAASDAAAGGRWGEQARVIAMKKLESRQKASSCCRISIIRITFLALCTAPHALAVMLRPKAAGARNVR